MDPKKSESSMSRDMDNTQAETPFDVRPGASLRRRSFMKGIGAASFALSAGALVSDTLHAEERSGALTAGDAAILRFLAAAELIETDLWQQYAELGSSQANEPPMITGLTVGNAAYIKALSNLDGEVLRILLSIGGTEIAHFQTWHDKAGNAPALTGVLDPVSGDTVDFPDLTTFAGNEDLQTNLIMPEPTVFLNKSFPVCSIIRPTATANAARDAVKSLTNDGLFIGQDEDFFSYLNDLAEDADEARRGF